MRLKLFRPTFARRVALAGALSSALAGGLAALVGGLTASRLVEAAENEEILRVSRDYAGEVAEELSEPSEEKAVEEIAHFSRVHGAHNLDNVLVHEAEDITLPGLSTALYRDGKWLAGDANLPWVQSGACLGYMQGMYPRRVCGVRVGADELLVGIHSPQDLERDALFRQAIGIGALMGAILGGLASLIAARWVVGPLIRLRDAVGTVSTDDPSAQALRAMDCNAEIDELRVAIAQLVDELGVALSTARAFASQAAHALRTPLAALSGELELLADGADPHDVQRARDLVHRLTHLVQRLLALATPVGRSAAEGEAVDLSDVAHDVVDSLPAEQRCRIQTTCQDDVLVRGDDALLCSLLLHAVENALKYSEGPVKVRVSGQGAHATIEVIDHGPGVALQERALVFTPFYRSQAARASRVAGHGLGLALIAHVAQDHGGEAAFDDVVEGAVLRVILPRWR